ncbi:hypothetical protein BCY86_07740 [Pajaroellobacter abortibovis]|uniref:Uncharacterized protein n=1 Tax=Pajaroellobacter abortibovis TaxID=1882918 RepID=A0A1L6MYN8_9BACT|nr:hypothetical protein BCY86_07740 [Pajaroellobacter abortibovis]
MIILVVGISLNYLVEQIIQTIVQSYLGEIQHIEEVKSKLTTLSDQDQKTLGWRVLILRSTPFLPFYFFSSPKGTASVDRGRGSESDKLFLQDSPLYFS